MGRAKEFLSQYRALRLRYNELYSQIIEAEAVATNTAARISPTRVQSGGPGDIVASTAAMVVDLTSALSDTAKQVGDQLSLILLAIDAVGDEMTKTILTKRYVSGKSWKEICSDVGYEASKVYDIHKRGLSIVDNYLDNVAKIETLGQSEEPRSE
jgi:hypothetical protein